MPDTLPHPSKNSLVKESSLAVNSRLSTSSKKNSCMRTQEILRLLEQANAWCSGEIISKHLGISRAAVSKHILTLRTAGHAIESITRRGYKLLVKHVPLDIALVQSHLETRVLGRQGWFVFEKIASSNQEAARQAMDGAPAGTILIAEQQSHGRGRKGHDWFSSPRGLYFSLILRPTGQSVAGQSVDTQGFMQAAFTQAAMSAVAQSLEMLSGMKAMVKQPNDVLLHTRKIAGILVETGFRGSELDWLVLGIGCNINAVRGDFPPHLVERCTSLYIETGQSFDRALCMTVFLNTLEKELMNIDASQGIFPVEYLS